MMPCHFCLHSVCMCAYFLPLLDFELLGADVSVSFNCITNHSKILWLRITNLWFAWEAGIGCSWLSSLMYLWLAARLTNWSREVSVVTPGLSSMSSLTLPQVNLGFCSWRRQDSKIARGSTQGLLRPGLRIGILSLLLYFIGQSKSPGKPRFKRWGNRPHFLMRRAKKWNYMDIGRK